MKKRRKFDSEFKKMVVELSYLRGNIAELAKEMEIIPDMIYRWRK